MNKEELIEYLNQGYSTWKLAEHFNTTQPNIRYWLKKYNFKTQRTINFINKDRQCLSCNVIKPQEHFYKRGKKYMSHCKECYQKNYIQKARDNKQKAIDYLGGCCSKCSYNKCSAALEFHHTNPNTKDYSPAHLMKQTSFSKLKAELDKCVLLCANCHREEHHLNTSN